MRHGVELKRRPVPGSFSPVAGVAALTTLAHRMNVLALGDEVAGSLGVNPSATRSAVFLWSSLVTGAAVAISGLVGFVGLVAPQALRLAASPDNRFLVPAGGRGGVRRALRRALPVFWRGWKGSQAT
ncbi:MAG: iron chelate uptake ABC transporter family permease subunit [Deltaproteobacteria bacterium]|nr:iron chelate uptake ABC transporter family permease subunit [Deltaproteobacteria bacterium]